MAHVLAWAFMTGEWPNTDVDHKNNIRNDNRWENLRLATRSQNNANSRRRKKDGFKGVRQKATCKNTWSISLKVCGKTITRSGFRSPEEASKAYMVLATEYFGEFARSG